MGRLTLMEKQMLYAKLEQEIYDGVMRLGKKCEKRKKLKKEIKYLMG